MTMKGSVMDVKGGAILDHCGGGKVLLLSINVLTN